MISIILLIYAGFKRSWKISVATLLISFLIQATIVIPSVTGNRSRFGMETDVAALYIGAAINVVIYGAIGFAIGYAISLLWRKIKS